MATFTDLDGPAGRRCPAAASRRCSTPTRRSCRPPTRCATCPRHGTLEMRGRRLPLPGRRGAGAQRHHLLRPPPGRTTAIVGSTGAGKTTLVSLVPRLFDATAGHGARRRRRRARARAGPALGLASGSCPQRPYLFSGTVASNLQFGKPDATEAEMWEALEVAQAADFVRAMPGRARGAHRAGRHQRLRRAAAAALDRPGAGAQAVDLRVRRLVLRPRPHHRRPAPRRPQALHVRGGRGDRRPARVDHRHRRRHPRAGGRPARRPRHPRGPPRELPHLRRDRPVPDRRAERRHEHGHRPQRDRRARRRRSTSPRRTRRAAGRWNSAGMPTERSDAVRRRRCGGSVQLLRPERPVLVPRRRSRRSSAPSSTCSGPRVLGRGHRRDHRRHPAARRASTSAGSTSAAAGVAVGSTSSRRRSSMVTAWMIAGVVQRLMHRCGRRPRPRSTPSRSATSTSRRAATC